VFAMVARSRSHLPDPTWAFLLRPSRNTSTVLDRGVVGLPMARGDKAPVRSAENRRQNPTGWQGSSPVRCEERFDSRCRHSLRWAGGQCAQSPEARPAPSPVRPRLQAMVPTCSCGFQNKESARFLFHLKPSTRLGAKRDSGLPQGKTQEQRFDSAGVTLCAHAAPGRFFHLSHLGSKNEKITH